MTAPSLTDAVLGGTVSVDSVGGVTVHTGAMYGPVDVTIEHLDRAPEGSAEDWEDVVELSIRATEDRALSLAGLFSDSADLGESEVASPVLSNGENYRLRVHTRGRDASSSDEQIEPDQSAKDHILLQLWPTSASPPAVLRVSSSKAGDDSDNTEYFGQPPTIILGLGDPEIESIKNHTLRTAGE